MHEYQRRLMKALDMGIIDTAVIAHAHIHHDDTPQKMCGIFSGKECDCDPNILIKTKEGTVNIGADGTADYLREQ